MFCNSHSSACALHQSLLLVTTFCALVTHSQPVVARRRTSRQGASGTLICSKLHMQGTAAANHARVSTSTWLATGWHSRFHLRKGLNSGNPVRSTFPTRAVFHPQLGRQIANIMTVQTDCRLCARSAVMSTAFTQRCLHALHCMHTCVGQHGGSAPCCCLIFRTVAHTGWICSVSSINSRTTTAVCSSCLATVTAGNLHSPELQN